MKPPWPIKKLGELIEERKEKNIKKEKLPVFTVSHIYGIVPFQKVFYKRIHSIDTSNYKIVKRYDFGFGLPTKNTLPFGLLEKTEKVLISPAYTVFYIKDEKILNSKFLFYLFKTNRLKFLIIETAKSKSATRHGLPLKFQDLAGIQIPLPPLSIQQKIVYVLDTIQSAVEVQEKIIEKTKELKKSMMADLFKYGGPSFRKGRKLKKTEIDEIPEDWGIEKIGDLVEMKYGYRCSIPNIESSNGVYIISTAEITTDGKLNLSKLRKVEIPEHLIESYTLHKGDLLFNWRNAPEHVGKTAILDFTPIKNYIYASFLIRLRCNQKKIYNKFLHLILNFFKEKRKFVKLSRRAVNQANYNAEELKELLVFLPSLEEQKEIVETIQTIDQKIEIEQKKKELYEELFKTMLNKLMNGEIDVDLLRVSELAS
ncbi:MAG: restriction endonuclease subunit S [Candidatus Omnitrophica bacterium]|nr:restriction endonuclease subunit S [Candidatus Omnitrophota bacterium]